MKSAEQTSIQRTAPQAEESLLLAAQFDSRLTHQDLSQKKDNRVEKYQQDTFNSPANAMSVKRYFSTAKLFLNFTRFIQGKKTTRQVPGFLWILSLADDTINASCYRLREENQWAKQQYQRPNEHDLVE